MIHITITHAAAARQTAQWTVALAAPCSLEEGLRTWLQDPTTEPACREAIQGVLGDQLAPSLWGRRVPLSERLRDGDRLELSRALLVDPKVARRERFKSQGSKSAGLFSKRRPGAKPGY